MSTPSFETCDRQDIKLDEDDCPLRNEYPKANRNASIVPITMSDVLSTSVVVVAVALTLVAMSDDAMVTDPSADVDAKRDAGILSANDRCVFCNCRNLLDAGLQLAADGTKNAGL